MKCNRCNEEMEYFIQGSSCGWKCNKCSDMIVTTYIDPLEEDETKYYIEIPTLEVVPANLIRIISQKCECNFVRAKEMLENGCEIENLKAKDIKDILIICKEDHISNIQIIPEYPHEI